MRLFPAGANAYSHQVFITDATRLMKRLSFCLGIHSDMALKMTCWVFRGHEQGHYVGPARCLCVDLEGRCECMCNWWSEARLLSPSPTEVGGQRTPCCGDHLCTAEHSAGPLASAHGMPVAFSPVLVWLVQQPKMSPDTAICPLSGTESPHLRATVSGA